MKCVGELKEVISDMQYVIYNMRKCKAVKLAVRLDLDVDLLPVLSHLNSVILFKIYFIVIHASAPYFSMSYTPFRASRQAV